MFITLEFFARTKPQDSSCKFCAFAFMFDHVMVKNSFNHFLQPFKRAFLTNWPFKMFYDILVYGWRKEKRDYWWPAKQTHRDHTAYGLEKKTLSRILFGWPIITCFRFFSFFMIAFYFSNLWLVFNAKKSSEPFFCFVSSLEIRMHFLPKKFNEPLMELLFCTSQNKRNFDNFFHFPFTTFFRWSSLAVLGCNRKPKRLWRR